MSRKGANVSLASYDDIFETDKSREEDQLEKVQKIPLKKLYPFKDHPFQVRDDEEMMQTIESISQHGILQPIIARPRPNGGFEIVSGHRRCHAAIKLGIETVPVLVRGLTDDEATILMVDSNLQREEILPSERAKAFKMKADALKHQGQRSNSTSVQVAPKLTTEIIGESAGMSKDSVKRYIRLTELIQPLLDLVDAEKLKFGPAVEISYLKKKEQEDFLEAMAYAQATPSLSQAQRLKKMSQDGMCTLEVMCAIMSEEKKGSLDRVVFKTDTVRKYFPKDYTSKQMEDTILKLLEQWQKKRERQQAR